MTGEILVGKLSKPREYTYADATATMAARALIVNFMLSLGIIW